jgi:hypothetical protein
VPLCLLPIKLPPDFSCGLKVSHKALLISYEVELTIIIMLSHGQSWPVQFLSCEFSVLRESCAYCRQSHGQISQRHKVSHKALLSVGSQISFIFPPHKLFFRMHIYQHGSVGLLSCKLLHTREGTNVLLVYLYILITRE